MPTSSSTGTERHEMTPHYFDKIAAPQTDVLLAMAKMQGYVPATCLLGGVVVMAEVSAGRSPCWGCEGPRDKCGGKPKRNNND